MKERGNLAAITSQLYIPLDLTQQWLLPENIFCP
jgi:hypothetical protein